MFLRRIWKAAALREKKKLQKPDGDSHIYDVHETCMKLTRKGWQAHQK